MYDSASGSFTYVLYGRSRTVQKQLRDERRCPKIESNDFSSIYYSTMCNIFVNLYGDTDPFKLKIYRYIQDIKSCGISHQP